MSNLRVYSVRICKSLRHGMGVLLTLLALGHPWPKTPGSRLRHPWLHRAPKALQQYPHPMSQPTAGVVGTGKLIWHVCAVLNRSSQTLWHLLRILIPSRYLLGALSRRGGVSFS